MHIFGLCNQNRFLHKMKIENGKFQRNTDAHKAEGVDRNLLFTQSESF